MALFIVSPLLKRLTFFNWDKKKGNPFRIDTNRIWTSAVWVSAFRRAPVRSGSVIPPSHRRRGATTVFGENRHHRSDTASSFSWFFPYPSHLFTAVEPPRDRRRVGSLLFRDCTAVLYPVTPEARCHYGF